MAGWLGLPRAHDIPETEVDEGLRVESIGYMVQRWAGFQERIGQIHTGSMPISR